MTSPKLGEKDIETQLIDSTSSESDSSESDNENLKNGKELTKRKNGATSTKTSNKCGRYKMPVKPAYNHKKSVWQKVSVPKLSTYNKLDFEKLGEEELSDNEQDHSKSSDYSKPQYNRNSFFANSEKEFDFESHSSKLSNKFSIHEPKIKNKTVFGKPVLNLEQVRRKISSDYKKSSVQNIKGSRIKTLLESNKQAKDNNKCNSKTQESFTMAQENIHNKEFSLESCENDIQKCSTIRIGNQSTNLRKKVGLSKKIKNKHLLTSSDSDSESEIELIKLNKSLGVSKISETKTITSNAINKGNKTANLRKKVGLGKEMKNKIRKEHLLTSSDSNSESEIELIKLDKSLSISKISETKTIISNAINKGDKTTNLKKKGLIKEMKNNKASTSEYNCHRGTSQSKFQATSTRESCRNDLKSGEFHENSDIINDNNVCNLRTSPVNCPIVIKKQSNKHLHALNDDFSFANEVLCNRACKENTNLTGNACDTEYSETKIPSRLSLECCRSKAECDIDLVSYPSTMRNGKGESIEECGPGRKRKGQNCDSEVKPSKVTCFSPATNSKSALTSKFNKAKKKLLTPRRKQENPTHNLTTVDETAQEGTPSKYNLKPSSRLVDSNSEVYSPGSRKSSRTSCVLKKNPEKLDTVENGTWHIKKINSPKPSAKKNLFSPEKILSKSDNTQETFDRLRICLSRSPLTKIRSNESENSLNKQIKTPTKLNSVSNENTQETFDRLRICISRSPLTKIGQNESESSLNKQIKTPTKLNSVSNASMQETLGEESSLISPNEYGNRTPRKNKETLNDQEIGFQDMKLHNESSPSKNISENINLSSPNTRRTTRILHKPSLEIPQNSPSRKLNLRSKTPQKGTTNSPLKKLCINLTTLNELSPSSKIQVNSPTSQRRKRTTSTSKPGFENVELECVRSARQTPQKTQTSIEEEKQEKRENKGNESDEEYSTPLKKENQIRSEDKRTLSMSKCNEVSKHQVLTPLRKKDITVTTPISKKKSGRGFLTPSMAKKEHVTEERLEHSLDTTRQQLHISTIPKSLPCRDSEFAQVKSFLLRKIEHSAGGCMYISGVPGTGKTATVHAVIRSLQQEVSDEEIPEFDFVEVNGLRLTEPRQAYVRIYQALTDQKVTPDQAQQLLNKKFSGKCKKSTIILVDELDYLCNRRQDVVYNILDWPTKRSSALVVLTISNTMDLPERTLKGRVTSRMGLTRLVFQPYTHHQLREIVQDRLCGSSTFHPDAIQLVARKVAAVSGDARRALDICRRTTELVSGDTEQVTVAHVERALTQIFSGPRVITIQSLSGLGRLLLRSLRDVNQRTGVDEANMAQVYQHLQQICVLEATILPPIGTVLQACVTLVGLGLIMAEKGRMDLTRKVTLNVSSDDIHYALDNLKL